ncbi:MAG: alpha/beta hydrolase, partial [Gemmatimonas sp.]
MPQLNRRTLIALSMGLITACSDGGDTATGPAPEQPGRGNEPVAERVMMNTAYGTDAAQRMDVYLPAERNAETPVVFVLHGGGFVAGSRKDFDAQSRALMSKGMIVVNVDYRLVDTTGLLGLPPVHRPSAVRIAEQVGDIRAAMQLVAQNASDWIVPATRWAVVGHSAGATLAMLYAYGYGGYNSDNRVTVAGNWAGATTLAYSDTIQFQGIDPRIRELYYRAVGAELTNANRLAFMAHSPWWLAFNGQARATINIRPENNVVIGEDVSAGEYASFTDVLNSKGVKNKFVLVPGADHGFGKPGNWT